ncbi:MAG: isochorismatase [Candidatus Tectimicrobiota bacterium]
MVPRELPIPAHFDADRVGQVWRVPYQERAREAQAWARQHAIAPAASDRVRLCLLAIDVQNTFCVPEFELYVGGRSGRGAVEDNVRLSQFIYRNLATITEIDPTLDTHTAMQIFHPVFLINDAGEHPQPLTPVSLEDVQQGVWKVNPAVASSLAHGDYTALQHHLLHYCSKLSAKGKYSLMIWPYHSMLGGIGHCLVSAVEEALFFHNIARHSQTGFEIKGGNPLTENYSVLRPEVADSPDGRLIAPPNTSLLTRLLAFDAVIIAGQAKSHCVAWTIDDLLSEILAHDPSLTRKVYVLEDCTSPVVVPGIVDFTEQADAAFQRFADAGMHLVQSTQPIASWPDFPC